MGMNNGVYTVSETSKQALSWFRVILQTHSRELDFSESCLLTQDLPWNLLPQWITIMEVRDILVSPWTMLWKP